MAQREEKNLVVSVRNGDVVHSKVKGEVEAAPTKIRSPNVITNSGTSDGLCVRVGELQVVLFGELPLKWEGFKKSSAPARIDFLEQVINLFIDPSVKFLGRDSQFLVHEAVGVKRGGGGSVAGVRCFILYL